MTARLIAWQSVCGSCGPDYQAEPRWSHMPRGPWARSISARRATTNAYHCWWPTSTGLPLPGARQRLGISRLELLRHRALLHLLLSSGMRPEQALT
jgi:hypothetical protein